MATRLAGQVALVTGGGRGIGRAICQTLDAEGARVIVHYGRNLAAAEQTLASLTQPGSALLQADLASTANISAAVQHLNENRIDVLVNNAGIWKSTPLGGTDEAVVDELLNVNLRGVFWLTQAILSKLSDARAS